jgi:arsenate reductase-like glutaredoxin family protein
MNRTKTLVIALWAMFVGQIASAQKGSEDQLIKDATAYFEQGAYLKAFPLYSQLVSLYPNHAEYAFKFGACAIYGDADKTKAVRYLNSAINKSVNDPEVYYFLGKAYHLNYQFKDAITAYENYVRYAGEKAPRKAETLRQIETCIYGANLLSNIKDITVLSKTETDKSNFFRYFNLEAIGGKILTVPDALKSKEDLKSTTPGVIHYPGNGTTIYFSSYGKNNSNGKDIYKAQVLPDGTFSEPVKLNGGVNTKYDEDFCFMHSDGRTLYFASKGHNSMGGYDIFKSVFDPTTGEFGPAVNLDFAINTPDDDIFYIADSLNQRAYFASGRSSDLDHLNVYSVMVETTPLQVVYLKGMYVSEIDPEQHKVGIKILESNTLRGVCDGNSNNTGEYIVYVPKSGQYTFKVVTENSPTVHEVSVKIPSFDKPVALRQEMRLINEGGKERIIINNYFEEPLNEDLSILAAEMLRKKSVLDVNSGDAPMVSLTKTDVKKEDELRTFDQNMDNATIAAGFEGGSIASVVGEMKSELNVIQRFVQESDSKRNNSLAYARKKQKEADALLSAAEAIRKSMPGQITTEAEIAQLRKMVELTQQAEAIQVEAQAAYNTAQAISTFKESETKRMESLQASIGAIQQAEQTRNYDATVAALTAEKDRRTAIRSGVEASPYDQMLATTKSLENERAKMETALNTLREAEKSKNRQVMRLKANIADPGIKAADKAAMQNELATAESELSIVRRDLAKQLNTFNKSEENINRSYAEANFFKKVNDDSTAGLATEDMIKLTATERDMLGMSIAALDTRVSQLEVTDPQMLAMLGEQAGSERNAPEVILASNDSPANNQAARTETQTVTQTESENGNSAVATDMTGEAAQLRSTLESRMAILETRPTLAPARPLLLREAVADTRERIASLEAKLLDGQISAAERSSLENLKNLETILVQDLTVAQASAPEVSSEDVREMCKVVSPEYDSNLSNIENNDISEIERAQQRMAYKSAVIVDLNKRQLANTRSLKSLTLDSGNEASLNELERLTQEDVQIAAALENLAAEANHITALKAAFEIENKAIIEGDQVFAKKLQDQLELGEQYLTALQAFETQQREAMNVAAPSEREQYEIELQAVAEQRQIVEAKQVAYRHDLELTASAADPTVNELSTDSVADVTVDELNPLATPAEDANVNTLRVEETTSATSELAAAAETQTEQTVNAEAQTEAVQPAITPAVESAPVATVETATETVLSTPAQTDVATTNTAAGAGVAVEQVNAETIETTESATATAAATPVTEEKAVEAQAKEIKEMFASKEEVKSIFAYETAQFEELVNKHPKISSRLNNREQIQQLNEEIFIIEGEMEMTKSEGSLKKMDVKAEQLYLKRSMLEIENASVVADMTREEYNDELSKSNEMIGLNQDKLNEKVQVRDEVAKLKRESDMNMEAAVKLREQARPIFDDIERADYYRQAYALEALAIDQQRQIQTICAKLEMLNQFTEPQLAMLKSGTVPADLREGKTEDASTATETAAPANTALELAMAENAAVAQQANPASVTTVTPIAEGAANVAISTEQPTSPVNAQTAAENLESQNAATEATEAAVPVENESPAANAATEIATEPVIETQTAAVAVENMSEDAGTFATRAETADPAKTVVVEAAPIAEIKSEEIVPATPAVSEAIATPVAPAASEGRAKASANAADYYYSMPSEVVADLFAKTARGVYSDSRPIPIDMEMPKGVYYKVQIGAFRNDIPQNLYDQFAPISGERLNTGITRYTAGFFVQFENAKDVKQQIRAMGYSDAFIVAYRDGKRIPLYEAAAITDGPELAASIKAAFEKAAVGSVTQNSSATTNYTVASSSANTKVGETNETAQNTVAANENKNSASQPSGNAVAEKNAEQAASKVLDNTSAIAAPAAPSKTEINVDAEVAAELARKPATRTIEEIEAAAAQPKNTEYYKAGEQKVAPAEQVEKIEGLFFTIQVGVYSKPVAAALLQNVNPLNSELTETNKIRYTSGQYNNMNDAVAKRDEIRKQGIVDAFVTAYYNGKRITLSEADLLLKEKGAGILSK